MVGGGGPVYQRAPSTTKVGEGMTTKVLNSSTELGILQLYSTISDMMDQNKESSQFFSLKPYSEFFSYTLGGIVLTWLGFCTCKGKDVYNLHGS